MRPSWPVAWCLPMILLSLPARAQHVYAPSGPAPSAVATTRPSTLRLNLGAALYNANILYCSGAQGFCTPAGKLAVPFLAGAEVDLAFAGGADAVGLGVNVLLATTSAQTYPGGIATTETRTLMIWEPFVDYLGLLGSPAAFVQGRLRAGVGAYLSTGGGMGGALRLGGGISLFRDRPFGFGLDVVAEAGYLHWFVGGVQLVITPEFHF